MLNQIECDAMVARRIEIMNNLAKMGKDEQASHHNDGSD